MEQPPIINILTYKLPVDITRPIHLEYKSRRTEIDRIWTNPKYNFQMLQGYASTVEALLAISIFYRHVMGHIQGAVSFYKSVNRNSGMNNECAIKVGGMVLDGQQQKRLSSAVIKFNQIQEKYQLDSAFFEYSETIQFMKNCKDLFYKKEYEEDNSI